MHSDEEIRLQGAPVSEGIAIGIPFFLSQSDEESVPEFAIAGGEIEEEIERYRRALFSSREDLEKLQNDLASEGSLDAVTIIDTHIQMLQDPLITTHMEEKIRHMHQNTESVFRSVITEYEKRFSQNNDSFFQQRLIDVMDVSKRIMGHLCPKQKRTITEIPPNSVVFAKDLVPSDTAAVQATRVSAFVTLNGGGNSHAALIARAKGIPFVASVDMEVIQNASRGGKYVIVDGLTGDVIVNPSASTLQKYKERKKYLQSYYHLLEKQAHLKAETSDGYAVKVLANISNIGELEQFHQYGASGIGLFRSEYLFLQNKDLSYDEEEQFLKYKELVEKAKGTPVVIRVFDIGGDKIPEGFAVSENNINLRGIRFLLRNLDIFKIQLRAIWRTTLYGDARILLPLISDIDELRQAKKIINQIKEELLQEGVKIAKSIQIGCMVELPSAVMIADLLAKESDFLSLGTNDLVQYSLGVDRTSTENDFYFPAHPSMVRMIKMISLEAQRYQKPVTVCGEISSHPVFIPLLLGLGVSQFSCAPRYIPLIKRAIRQASILETYQLADTILRLSSTSEISNVLLEAFRKTNPDELSCVID